jgi:hypothetical protein
LLLSDFALFFSGKISSLTGGFSAFVYPVKVYFPTLEKAGCYHEKRYFIFLISKGDFLWHLLPAPNAAQVFPTRRKAACTAAARCTVQPQPYMMPLPAIR